MAISIHPRPGQILLCDFSEGFRAPEMVKASRPVVVVSGVIKGRSNLVSVVPISSTEPIPPQGYHYQIPIASMPMTGRFQHKCSWVKADMLYTVGFHRLNLIRLGKRNQNGKRCYFTTRLGKEQMKKIYQCMLIGLNLEQLGAYL